MKKILKQHFLLWSGGWAAAFGCGEDLEPLHDASPRAKHDGSSPSQACICRGLPKIGNQHSHLVPGSPSEFVSSARVKLDGRLRG